MLVSTFEVLLKPQFPTNPGGFNQISRTVIQGYFLTIANVNFFPVTVSLVFTIKFPADPTDPAETPTSFKDFINAVDISGQNLFSGAFSQATLVPEIVPQNNKARLTFTIPDNTTSLLILQPDFINQPGLLTAANFEARGYVEIFLSSLSGSDTATLLITPEQRGTFFKDLKGETLADIGLDQIVYPLPISNGGVFKLSNS
ncbi:MAG: hypothetical protein KME21_20180 [Desmonostoc vinosum HA7617-LM4]|jgi:hypothetical protein|nr:hypothetical protein [Desmonostoc vinosum HA7617-LM4]